jgi:signal transduction histidine kinase
MMPEMSGIELCRAIKADAETRTVPVVLVTSKAEREMKIEGLELGADDYVTKPFHPRELLARVRALVRVTSLQRQLAVRNERLEQALHDLKQAEVQLVQSERLAAVGELAAGVAHEVNNPVNFALNAARAMEANVKDLRGLADELSALDPAALPEGVRRRLALASDASAAGGMHDIAETLVELSEIIEEGLSRTSALVTELRDFAAPGRAGVRSAGVQVEKGMRSTLQLLKHALDERGARVELTVDGELPRIVADAGGLNQVFLNLVKNAAECFDEAGGTIRVALRAEGGELVIEVADDGPGIPDEHLGRLFEPFYTTKETGDGTGLGLSISRQIVTAHGGTLGVTSEVGGGTRFTVRLPVEGSAPAPGEDRAAGASDD